MIKGKISAISDEAEQIKGFRIQVSLFSFKPGKYLMLAFPDRPEVKKAFSIISYDETSSEASIAVKREGEFTSRLFFSNVGDYLLVYGPFGRFILGKEEKPLVFIAGGIGITPLLSLLLSVHNSTYNYRLHLFYSSKRLRDMAFYGKISRIHDPRVKVYYFFTAEKNDKGLNGRISLKFIRDSIPEFDKCSFYICGPSGMISEMRDSISAAGVPLDSIMSEEFS